MNYDDTPTLGDKGQVLNLSNFYWGMNNWTLIVSPFLDPFHLFGTNDINSGVMGIDCIYFNSTMDDLH